MRALVLTSLMLSAVFVGCISSGDGDLGSADDDATSSAYLPELDPNRVAAASEDLSQVIDPDHGGVPYLHAVPHLHEGIHGMELVGYNPLTRVEAGDDPLGQDSGYAAIDTWENLVCVAHFAGSTGTMGGATIVDISDPADPVVLSSILSGAVNSDCQFTDDGQYLLLATYAGAKAGLPLTAVEPPLRDAASNGLSVYDVSDPADPKFLFHDHTGVHGMSVRGQPVDSACTSCAYHNVFTAQINGTHYVFQTYTNQILKIKEDRSGLEIVSHVNHSSHDWWVGKHPITGGWMAVTGAAYGTAIFDVNDPTEPTLLGVWEGDRDNRSAGWHRQWVVDGTIDGRAYLVVAGEECSNGDSLPYQVLDWTDPSAPYMTGSWWIPGKPANPRAAEPHLCEMNSHEFEVWNGYVATGNYHAGVWLFDVGSPNRTVEPATIGYYLPSEKPYEHGGAINAPFVWSPDVWGGYFDERGYIITADWWSGLYVLKFDATLTEDAHAAVDEAVEG